MIKQEPYIGLIEQISTRVDGVVSIYLYGSQVHMLRNVASDIDLQIVLTVAGSVALNTLRDIEKEYAKEGYKIGFMVHTESEILSSEGFLQEIFIHRNRCWFFIKEMKESAKLLWGKDIFTHIDLPSQPILIAEAARILRSLAYEARKKYVNKSEHVDSDIDLIKYTLYASQYFCLVIGFPYYRIEPAVAALVNKFPKLKDLSLMLELKRNNYNLKKAEWQQVSEQALELLEYFSSEASLKYAEFLKENTPLN